jgi:hypothetical protein
METPTGPSLQLTACSGRSPRLFPFHCLRWKLSTNNNAGSQLQWVHAKNLIQSKLHSPLSPSFGVIGQTGITGEGKIRTCVEVFYPGAEKLPDSFPRHYLCIALGQLSITPKFGFHAAALLTGCIHRRFIRCLHLTAGRSRICIFLFFCSIPHGLLNFDIYRKRAFVSSDSRLLLRGCG